MSMKNENVRRNLRYAVVVAVVLVFVTTFFAADASAQKKTVKPKKAAGIGALLGLALGGGVWDVAAGAALGAAGGHIAKEAQTSNQNKAEAKRQHELDMQAAKAYQESSDHAQDLAVRETRVAALEDKLNYTVQVANDTEAAFIEAIGDDNWAGYMALRACQYDRANALAGVGAVSSVRDHQVASVWLLAMTAVDRKDSETADIVFEELVNVDTDIDTVQQASLATDKAVLELRSERAAIGIPPCK